MIERGSFEPLSPKKDFDFKDFDFNVLKLILTLRLIAAGLIDCRASLAMTAFDAFLLDLSLMENLG
jgi:hypothetical protein